MFGDEVASTDAREGHRPGISTSKGIQIPERAGGVLRALDFCAEGCVPDLGADVGGL